MACSQETMLEKSEARDWNLVGRGFLEGFLAVNAIGRSGGVVITWNEAIFSKKDTGIGQFSSVVKLRLLEDSLEMAVVSVYGSTNAMRKELWMELADVADTFQGLPLLIGIDFKCDLSRNGACGLCLYVEEHDKKMHGIQTR